VSSDGLVGIVLLLMWIVCKEGVCMTEYVTTTGHRIWLALCK
jgi:hypothetical protein